MKLTYGKDTNLLKDMNRLNSILKLHLNGITLFFCLRLNAQSPDSGSDIFKYNCSNCHSPRMEVVGPALMDVVKQKDFKWFMFYTIDAQSLIARGDKRAIGVQKKYNIEHPKFHKLQKAEIKKIYDYIKKYNGN